MHRICCRYAPDREQATLLRLRQKQKQMQMQMQMQMQIAALFRFCFCRRRRSWLAYDPLRSNGKTCPPGVSDTTKVSSSTAASQQIASKQRSYAFGRSVLQRDQGF
jgi:hypothetical protein